MLCGITVARRNCICTLITKHDFECCLLQLVGGAAMCRVIPFNTKCCLIFETEGRHWKCCTGLLGAKDVCVPAAL